MSVADARVEEGPGAVLSFAGRGLSLSLTPAWGADSGGTDRLWSASEAVALAPANDGANPQARLEAEAAGRRRGLPECSRRTARRGEQLAQALLGQLCRDRIAIGPHRLVRFGRWRIDDFSAKLDGPLCSRSMRRCDAVAIARPA